MAKKVKLVQLDFASVRNRKRFEEMNVSELERSIKRHETRLRFLQFL